MKKFITTLMASMLLLSSTTYATEKFGKLNKADTQTLFGKSNVEALALDQGEMAKTEGEWFWAVVAAIAIGWASRTPAHAPDLPGRPLPGQPGNPYDNGRNYVPNGNFVVRTTPAVSIDRTRTTPAVSIDRTRTRAVR